MAITLYGGTTIQPIEVNISASQQKTTFVFLSSDSGSYIYSGSNPNFIFDGTASYHTSSLTFEDSGSTFSFVFSGSGFGGSPSSSLPGTTLSASINGLSSSADIALSFTASVVAATNMTASIMSGSIVTLINSAYSSSATTTSSFSSNTLFTFTSQSGNPSGTMVGGDTTGSLTVNGGFEVQGSRPINIGTNKGSGTPSITIAAPITMSDDISINGNARLRVTSASTTSTSKGAGTATLTGGNALISGSDLNNAFIFLQRVSGSNANAGHLYIASQSDSRIAIYRNIIGHCYRCSDCN